MSCCGRSRAAKTKNTKVSNKGKVLIEYLGTKHIALFSSASMRSYTFSTSPSQRVQSVNAQDAELLLRKRNFRRSISGNRRKG